MAIQLHDIVIINDVGFDGGGIAKLSIEYSKLGFNVYVKNTVRALQSKPENVGSIKFYNFDTDLFNIVADFKRVIFLTFYDDNLDKSVKTLKLLRELYPEVEFCYLYCDRNLVRLNKLLMELQSANTYFDYYYSLNLSLSEIVSNSGCFDINAFVFSDNIIDNERQKIILTAGRVEAFKGVINYFKAVDSEFLSNDFTYIHEGARFNFNKSGTVSTPPQLLCLFDMSKSPKVLKEQFSFSRYSELPNNDKLTIYPSYNPDSIRDRWSNYYAGICCILGSKSVYQKKKTLLDNDWVASDSRENSRINRNSKLWNTSLEYANLEMIDCGLPVLFSRKYSQIIGFNDERLIYDSFSLIPRKLDGLSDCYYEVQRSQREFFTQRQAKINENIKKMFRKDLGE